MVTSIALFMICGVALGYAALSSSIKINGTGTISTNWDILFTNIAEKSKKAATTNKREITDKLTATFDVDLESPGSYIEYNVTLKNNGNMDAVIAKVIGIVEANQQAPTGIQFKVSGIRIGDDLLAGSETTFVVRAEIPRSETTLPETSKTLELTVEVRQKEVDNSGLVTTIGECFQTNAAGDTITGYLCGKGNTNGYSEITNVNIPREINGITITQIGTSAFNGKGLTSVIMPNTIKGIGASAFMSNQLTSLELPNTVTTIGVQSFRGNRLKKLILPSSMKTIGNEAFMGNQISELEIPSSVTSIGAGAFRNNQLPDEQAFIYNRNRDGSENRRSINSYAGAKRSDVVIPSGVTIIGGNSFNGLGLKSIVLPEGLERIEIMAFGSNELTEITIPASVTFLSSSFGSNKNLSRVTFMGNVPRLDRHEIFKGAKLTSNTIQVPAGTLEQYRSARATLTWGEASPSQTWFGSDDASLLDAFYEG